MPDKQHAVSFINDEAAHAQGHGTLKACAKSDESRRKAREPRWRRARFFRLIQNRLRLPETMANDA
jgi:predicted metal-dependent hydrolase